MSADCTSDDTDDIDPPAVERDAISTGAAADWDEGLKGLPRLTRFAMLVSRKAHHIEQRLVSSARTCHSMRLGPQHPTWAPGWRSPQNSTIVPNEPNLRGVADCVRSP